MVTSLVTREPRRLASWFGSPFSMLRREMEDMFSPVALAESPLGGISPELDVAETDKTVEVRMDAPGLKAEEFDIRVNHNMLTISGERKEEKEEKSKTFHRVERRYGSFSRSVWLPCDVSGDEAVAEYKDGVLKVTVPKTAEAKSQRVKVKG